MNGLYVILTVWICMLSCLQESSAANTVCDTVACTDTKLCVNGTAAAQFCEIKPCAATTDCGSQGACTVGTGGDSTRKYCVCNPGYSGPACATVTCDTVTCAGALPCVVAASKKFCQITPCTATTACSSHGTCTAGTVDATKKYCACSPGYSGPACATPVCASACQNGGVCTAKTGGNQCVCVGAFGGTQCQTPFVTCGNVACGAIDACVSDAKGGTFCPIAACVATTCGTHGACTVSTTATKKYCKCNAAFTGPTCATAVCAKSCQHGGLCTAKTGGNQCVCVGAFGGAQCQTPFANCGTVACDDTKACVTGTKGAKFCQIDPCTNAAACSSHGKCTAGTEAGVAKKYCDCNPGYKGPACATPPVCTPSCKNGGTCVYHDPGNNTCSCKKGFTGAACESAMCNGDTCTNAGPCINDTSVLHCPISQCTAATACNSHGKCTAWPTKSAVKFCKCSTGYNGATCGTKVTTAAPAKTTPGSAGHRLSASLGVLLVAAAYSWVQ